MAKSCKWYRTSKIRELNLNDLQPFLPSHSASPTSVPSSANPASGLNSQEIPSQEILPPFEWDAPDWPSFEDTADDFDIDPSEDIERDEFLLLPPPVPVSTRPATNQSSKSSTHRSLDDNDDARVEDLHPTAGQVIGHAPSQLLAKDKEGDTIMLEDGSEFAPFSSELDWRFAEWAVKDGPGQKAIDRLLAISGVCVSQVCCVSRNFSNSSQLLLQVQEKLGLSYNNIRALLQKVDSIPDRAGEWQTKELFFHGQLDEKYTIRFRNPIDAIKSLFADPALEQHRVYGPKKVYTDETRVTRIFSEICTGKWWHVLQVSVLQSDTVTMSQVSFKALLPPEATVAPVIIATDKTQLTQFSGGKSAYPVYLTIGNLPKAIRRKPSKNACILIAYLSVDKLKRSRMTEFEHRSRVQRLFHEAMRIVMEPLKMAGKEGVDMTCSNGDIRRVYPILTCYAADYPEQCLVACTKYGTCPKCQCSANNLADPEPSTGRTRQWTESIIDEAKKKAGDSAKEFHKECMAHDVAGGVYVPFWHDFPYTDIHKCITPDVLHQLYQGVFKHVVSWCQSILGEKVLDQRIQSLPLGFGLRQFKNGISNLSQISGSERKNMAKILLGCLVGIMAPSGIKAVKALLDFIYLVQYSTHNTVTLGYIKDALTEFHQNKEFFIQVECREHLNLPKLHSLLHYVESIELFGTTDNYNTEMFERLHIDFAKHGWRATNQRDEFPQMIRWLSRQEKISYFNTLTGCRIAENNPPASNLLPLSKTTASDPNAPISTTPIPPSKHRLKAIAKFPDYPHQSISLIERLHNAPHFGFSLKKFLNSFLEPRVSNQTLNTSTLPFSQLDVYKMFRFRPVALNDDKEEHDIVKAIPKSQVLPHGRFDTVVVIIEDDAESHGLAGKRTIFRCFSTSYYFIRHKNWTP
jgi:hypothetical protein